MLARQLSDTFGTLDGVYGLLGHSFTPANTRWKAGRAVQRPAYCSNAGLGSIPFAINPNDLRPT
jgi:hypothetical protein